MKNKILAGLTAVVLVLGSAMVAKTAVSTLAGLAVAQSSTVWNSVKDAAIGDAQTNGILMSALALFNGSTFDRARGDTTFGLDVDVTRMPGGSQTPADAFTNPTTFNGAWSLQGLYNGTTWDRQRSALTSAIASNTMTTGMSPAGLYAFDFTGATTGRYKPLLQLNNTLMMLPSVTGASVNITTNTDTFITLGANAGLVLTRLIVATPGVTSNVILRTEPDGSAPCGGAGSTIVATFSTLTFGAIDFGGYYATAPFCLTTAGGTPANLMVMYTVDGD